MVVLNFTQKSKWNPLIKKTSIYMSISNYINENYDYFDDLSYTLGSKYTIEYIVLCYLRSELIPIENYRPDFEFNYEILEEDFIDEIKKIHSPSKRSIYEYLLNELGLESTIEDIKNLNNITFKQIDINRVLLWDLSENIDPAYFGTFIEAIIAFTFNQQQNFSINLIDSNLKLSKIITKEELISIYNKIIKSDSIQEIDVNINYNRFQHISFYHYLAFYSFIGMFYQKEDNYIEFYHSYFRLITKLNSESTLSQLDKFCQDIFNNKLLNSYFKKAKYQHEVIKLNQHLKSELHGYMDFYNENENIIDIKTSKRSLLNSKQVDDTLKTWFKQITIYDYCLENVDIKKYIIFNPLSGYICEWE